MSHYVHVADQKRFLVGHSMLRILLSRYLAREPDDIILLNSKHGKLYMPQSNVSFNISHSGNRVALAFVKEKKIGVDIERMNSLDDYSQIAKNFFCHQKVNGFVLKQMRRKVWKNFMKFGR